MSWKSIPLALTMMLLVSAAVAEDRLPIIDMHMHAFPVDMMGEPPLAICAPFDEWPTWDQRQPYGAQYMHISKNPECANPVWSAEADEALMQETIKIMGQRNIIAVLSGPSSLVAKWQEAAPERFIPGLAFSAADETPFDAGVNDTMSPEILRQMIEEGNVEVLGEVINQYAGLAPNDERMAPYWALAEELEIPVGIHIGPGAPGVRYLNSPGYRARLHNPLALEEVLVEHPKLRVYVMHAGYPMIDEMLAMLYTHPQLHVDIAVLTYTQPPEEFHRFLRRIVEAGFVKRVMWGSDQMVWPGVIEPSLAAIEAADYLSEEDKRDILYNNAARFLRLTEDEIARHHRE